VDQKFFFASDLRAIAASRFWLRRCRAGYHQTLAIRVYFHIMQNDVVFAPWRIEYLRSLDKADGGECFFCEAAAASGDEKKQRLVLWTTPHSVVLMNRYPYTNGHLLIAPRAHKAEMGDLSPDEMLDLQQQTARAIQLLRQAVSAQGFNVGINLGRCAGAGVPGHLHQHLVPRWAGDTNFISIVGETRIVPQALSQLYDELLRVVGEL
jgi:ATP adenylyltransferase